MPTRLLREGILTSDRVDTLSATDELFYRRLMSVVDDFGRYDARPAILRSVLYPLRIDRTREADIVRSLARCQEAGLIRLYTCDGKQYLEYLDFRQQVRAKASKFPDPDSGEPLPITCAADAKHVIASVHLDGCGDEGGCGDEDVTPKAPKGAGQADEEDGDTSENNKNPEAVTETGAQRVLPSGWQKLKKREQGIKKVLCNNRLMIRIGKFFNRKEDTLWTIAEAVALKEINPKGPAVELLESYYLAALDPDRDHRRKDLMTLLNNWNGELDRANGWKFATQ